MEIGPLFSDAKWKILKMLSEKEFSPLQLAQELETTIPNISQQLKLLEVAGLVEKRRVSNKKSNKPRLLFSLSSDYLYVVACMNHCASKNFFKATPYHRSVIRIWQLENPEMHYYLEKAFFYLLEKCSDLALIAVDKKIPYDPEFILVSEQPRKVRETVGILEIKKPGGKPVTFDYKVLSTHSFQKLSRRKGFTSNLLILSEQNAHGKGR